MIVLTAATDPTCRAIASFLYAQLSGLETEAIEVETVLDYDGMVGGAAIDFPLLQVYRLGSRGSYLETTELNIDYYLYSVAALSERPGILRLVESAIAHSITDRLPYSGLSDCVRVSIESSSRSFLRLESGEIFPFVRLTAELEEIDVTTPGVYVPVDLNEITSPPPPVVVQPASSDYEAEAVESIEVGQPLYLNSDGTVGLAQANHPLKAQVCGLAKTAAFATFTTTFSSEGAITRSDWSAISGSATLAPGAEYFLSATAGQITSIPPVSGYVAPIGRALTSTKLDIEIQQIIKL